MNYLKPVKLKKSYYAGIEATINRLFFEMCFAPALAAFKQNKVQISIKNAVDPIAEAILSGKIFANGKKFTGQFTAAISKQFCSLGATFNRIDKSWNLAKLPVNISMAIADADLRLEQIKQQILINLNEVQISSDTMKSRIIPEYQRTIHEINDDIIASVKSITIPPELTYQMQHNIAKIWGENLELYIQNWTTQNILKLRQEVMTNTYHGLRAEGLIKNIQQDYGVSKRKAKFLARQETSLLMSQIRQERFADSGVTAYKWSGSFDERERPDHRVLEGKIFTWDNPPITDRSTGKRAHPGQDFNCRCIAIPVVK